MPLAEFAAPSVCDLKVLSWNIQDVAELARRVLPDSKKECLDPVLKAIYEARKEDVLSVVEANAHELRMIGSCFNILGEDQTILSSLANNIEFLRIFQEGGVHALNQVMLNLLTEMNDLVGGEAGESIEYERWKLIRSDLRAKADLLNHLMFSSSLLFQDVMEGLQVGTTEGDYENALFWKDHYLPSMLVYNMMDYHRGLSSHVSFQQLYDKYRNDDEWPQFNEGKRGFQFHVLNFPKECFVRFQIDLPKGDSVTVDSRRVQSIGFTK